MLVLSRKKNESILIGDDIVITIVEVRRDKVRIGIHAPRDQTVIREELSLRHRLGMSRCDDDR